MDWFYGNQIYFHGHERVYEQAAANAIYAGYHFGAHLYQGVRNGLFAKADIHLIGFDLGAHLAHYAGIEYERLAAADKLIGDWPDKSTKITSIYGLDPPIYGFEDIGAPLSTKSAEYVQIIHSNSIQVEPVIGRNVNWYHELSEKERNEIIVENIKYRRFGDHRNLGHDDIYLNEQNQESGNRNNLVHHHEQCVEDDLSEPYFGCYSAMAARVFHDALVMRKGELIAINSR